MVRIVTFEGSDYSGKTTTFKYMAKRYADNSKIIFNEGPIYPNDLTSRLLIVANQANELEKEFLYSMVFLQDNIILKRNKQNDERIFIQDRYWPSVVAYGRFINREKSIYNNLEEFKRMFIIPNVCIHFICSYEERIRRSKKREKKSLLDNLLLNNRHEFERLEKEIRESLKDLPNVFEVDTSNKNVEEVADIISQYLINLNLF